MPAINVTDLGATLTSDAKIIFLSGGFGSEVGKRMEAANQTGSPPESTIEKGSTFRAPLHAPEIVQEVHEAYANAGADILTADSFCASVSRAAGDENLALKHAQAAADIAEKVSRAHTNKPLVALSLTASGDCYEPRDTPNDGVLREEHRVNIALLADKGDFIIAETLPTIREAGIIAEIANQQRVPFMVSMVVDDEGRVVDGSSMEELVESVLSPHSYCMGVGINCCSIKGAHEAVSALSRIFSGQSGLRDRHIIAYPNGFKLSLEENAALDKQHQEGECSHQHHNQPITAEEGFEVVQELVQRGATIVGLCCGSTPDHTAAYTKAASATIIDLSGSAATSQVSVPDIAALANADALPAPGLSATS